MDSSYDSDISEGTHDLVRRGLASDRKRRSSRADLDTEGQSLAPNRDMNTMYVRLPPTLVVQAEEPSARGLNLTGLESVKGQNYNTYTATHSSNAVHCQIISKAVPILALPQRSDNSYFCRFSCKRILN